MQLLLGLGAGGGWAGNAAVPLFAFGGALGALLLIEWIATVGGQLTVYTILLTGAIFNAFSAALLFSLSSHQCPMSTNEQTPTSSQPTMS